VLILGGPLSQQITTCNFGINILWWCGCQHRVENWGFCQKGGKFEKSLLRQTRCDSFEADIQQRGGGFFFFFAEFYSHVKPQSCIEDYFTLYILIQAPTSFGLFWFFGRTCHLRSRSSRACSDRLVSFASDGIIGQSVYQAHRLQREYHVEVNSNVGYRLHCVVINQVGSTGAKVNQTHRRDHRPNGNLSNWS